MLPKDCAPKLKKSLKMRIVTKNLAKLRKIQENSGNNNQKGQNAMIMQAGIRMQVGIFLKFNKNVVPNKGMQEGKFPQKK